MRTHAFTHTRSRVELCKVYTMAAALRCTVLKQTVENDVTDILIQAEQLLLRIIPQLNTAILPKSSFPPFHKNTCQHRHSTNCVSIHCHNSFNPICHWNGNRLYECKELHSYSCEMYDHTSREEGCKLFGLWVLTKFMSGVSLHSYLLKTLIQERWKGHACHESWRYILPQQPWPLCCLYNGHIPE